MNNIDVYVGLDYHQSSIQLGVMDKKGKMLSNRSCANDWKAIKAQAEKHGRVVRAAIESCSGASDLADELVQLAKWQVNLAHPGYVSRMKQNPDKSDFSDTRMLADLTRVGYLPGVWLAPKQVREMRLLVRFRQQLVNHRRSLKLRIGAVLREQRVRNTRFTRWSRPWVAWVRQTDELSEQGRWVIDQHFSQMEFFGGKLKEAEGRLSEFTKKDTLVERLLSFRGIGPVTAWVIRAEIGRFDRFASGKQLSRFCGLTPRNASSGERQADAGLIRAANRSLRATLIEAAHRLARYDPRFSLMAQKMRSRGKPGSVVAAAVANRWMRWLFHQLKQEPATA